MCDYNYKTVPLCLSLCPSNLPLPLFFRTRRGGEGRRASLSSYRKKKEGRGSEREGGERRVKRWKARPDALPAIPANPGRLSSRGRGATFRTASDRFCRWRCSRAASNPWCPCNWGLRRARAASSQLPNCSAPRRDASPSNPPSFDNPATRHRSPALLSPSRVSSTSWPRWGESLRTIHRAINPSSEYSIHSNGR